MVVRRWSTPERREGDRLLAPIPIEVYLLIFDEIKFEPERQSLGLYKSILSNLALVCRFFSVTLSPKIYNHFLFDGSSFEDDLCYSPQAKWLDNLDERDEDACFLAKHVKEVSFLQWRDPTNSGEWKSECSRDRYSRALPCFPNTVSFTITRTPIPLEFFDAIVALPHLRILRIKDCMFEEMDDAVEFLEPEATKLTHVEVSSTTNFRYYRKALADLVATSSLQMLKTTHWRFARAIIRKQVDMPLELLDVPLVAKDAMILSDFLNRTPSITDLALVTDPETENTEGQEPKLDILPTSLPTLKSLRCPSYLLPTLCPGRPLEKLNLVESQDWLWPKTYECHELGLLKTEKAIQLQRLDISISMYHAVKLRDHIPRIDTLCICFPYIVSSMPCRAVIKALCSMHEQPPTIRRLKLQFFGGINIMWAFNLTYQQQLIRDELANTFTSATSVCLSDGLEWHLDKETKEWKPTLEMPEFYRSLLLASDELFWQLAKVRDPDGMFTALFKEEDLSDELRHHLGMCGCPEDSEEDNNLRTLVDRLCQ